MSRPHVINLKGFLIKTARFTYNGYLDLVRTPSHLGFSLAHATLPLSKLLRPLSTVGHGTSVCPARRPKQLLPFPVFENGGWTRFTPHWGLTTDGDVYIPLDRLGSCTQSFAEQR